MQLVANASRLPSGDVPAQRLLPLRAPQRSTRRGPRVAAIQVGRTTVLNESAIVNFWDFFCPHRWRRLAVATRFGGLACRFGGLQSHPSRAQIVGLRGIETSGTSASLDTPPQRLQTLGRGGALHLVALAISLGRHALGMVAQRYGKVGMVTHETAMGRPAPTGRSRPRHISLPTNWRGRYPPSLNGPHGGNTARPRRGSSPSNCNVFIAPALFLLQKSSSWVHPHGTPQPGRRRRRNVSRKVNRRYVVASSAEDSLGRKV